MTMFDADTERVLEHVRSRRGRWFWRWFLLDGVALRRRISFFTWPYCTCPISDMRGLSPGRFGVAAYECGIPYDIAVAIADAADGHCHNPLRAALLEAAGLSEKGEKR